MPIDIISGNEDGQISQAHGDVAQILLANNMNVQALRTNATLRKDEWIALDKAVVKVARERLNVVSDLMTNNLTFNVKNAMGTLVVQHETATEFTAAETTMDGVTHSSRDRQLFNLVSTPLPITHKDFQITLRNLEASRKLGQSLDTSQAEEAMRSVAETMESLTLNGLSLGDTLGFGSSSAQLFGYTNRTGRNTVSIGSNWDSSAATGATILANVLAMINSAQADNMFGPYMLYVPQAYWVELLEDFKSNSDKTIFQRLKEIPGIIDIKPADKLTANNVLLVQMTSSNVDMIVGQQPIVVSWATQGGMVLNFKVLTIMVPRIKLDAGGRSGVVHLS